MTKPNILFILSDQHSKEALGCYGDKVGVTPNLDRLADGGVVFDNAYCASPICGPSRMSLMTGKQPHENRCWLNGDVLNSGTPTYAHALGAAGYRTALIGRMHFIGPDQTHGFGERLVGDHSANWPGNPTLDHGELRGTSGPNAVSVTLSGAGVNAYDLKDRDTTAAAVGWLAEEGKRQVGGATDPFHMTLGFMLPHPPYVADADDHHAMAGKVPPPAIDRPANAEEHPWHREWRGICGIDTLNKDDVARSRQAYWGMVQRLDSHVGMVLDALEAAGLRDNTLIIYASDHGDHLGNRDLFWKHTFYEESVGVPLILNWPGQISSAQRCSALVGLTDLAATMVDAAGGTWTGGGHSLLSLGADPDAPWSDEVVSEYCVGTRDGYAFPQPIANRMIRRGMFKLCYYHGYPPELFDLEADPQEQRNLAEDTTYAPLLDEMMTRVLADWDPDMMVRALEQRDREAALLTDWARITAPPESHRWNMPPGLHPSLTPN